MSAYDAIAALYDPWSRSVTEDVDFYVAQARKAGGPVVELGIGTGRIAVPIAKAGARVIGIDDSESMLALCRRRAEEAGVSDLVELRLGDLRRPPVLERVRLVTCPFRALLHLGSDGERLEALRAVYLLLEPGGRFVFDMKNVVTHAFRYLGATPDRRRRNFPPRAELRSLLGEAGFVNAETRPGLLPGIGLVDVPNIPLFKAFAHTVFFVARRP